MYANGSLRHAMPSLLVLVEPIPNEFMPRWDGHAKHVAHTPKTSMPLPRPKRFVYAPHFYDLNVLFFKSYKGMSVNVQGLSRGMFLPFALYFGQRGLAKKYVTIMLMLVICARFPRLFGVAKKRWVRCRRS